VADYVGDFQGGAPAAGWNYLWNPSGKTSPAAGFVPLKWSNVAGAYNTTGGATRSWSGGAGHPDDYLSLAAWGGHPGQPGYNAIASYTIQPDDGAGLYRLADATIRKADGTTSPGEDGLNLLVYVNNYQSGAIQQVPTSGSLVSFDRTLGQLGVGDTVYVMASAAGNQTYDSFLGFDFTLQKSILSVAPPVTAPPMVPPPVIPHPAPPPVTPPTGVWVTVSDYVGDFRSGTPLAGWKYQWNPTGKLGSAAAFAPLKWSSVAGAYNTTGAATPSWSGGKGHPDDYLSLASWGGHPGQPGYNAIASYTIQAEDGDGLYRIVASSLMKFDAVKTGNEDPLSLTVYVNNTLRGSTVTAPTSGAAVNFDRDLGQLAVGDTIHVIIGAGGNQNYDLFKNFNFFIQKLMPAVALMASVPEPTSAALVALALCAIPAARRRRPRRFMTGRPSC
jgi:MYXO-CTERM domain-containing protein